MISGIEALTKTPVLIQDAGGRVIRGKTYNGSTGKYPIKLEGEIIGWVSGGGKCRGSSLLPFSTGSSRNGEKSSWP